MAGYDYQRGPEFDYFDRMLPYEIPGEVPTYDPALFKTSRMRGYHESFPQQDSGVSELADIKQRLGRVADITTSYNPPPTDNRLFRMVDELLSKYKSVGLKDLPAAWEYLWHPEAFDQGEFTGNIEIDPVALAMGISGGVGTGGSRLAASGRGMAGKGSAGASELLSAQTPGGGNVWGTAKQPAQKSGQPGPGYIREDPEVLRQIRAQNLRARAAQPSSEDAMEQVMQSPGQLATWLERAQPEESVFSKQTRPENYSSWDLTKGREVPPEITGTELNYRVDSQGRRRVIPDEPIKGSYSQYTGPTKNTEGFWEDVTSPGRRAYDFVNNDVAEVVNALLRAPGEIGKYGKEIGKGLVGDLKQGAQYAAEDAWKEGLGPSIDPLLTKITDLASKGIKKGRQAGILDEEPMYYTRNKQGDWGQSDWFNAMPQNQKADYRSLPNDWRRNLMALKERDLPAISDLIDRHPIATIGGTALGGASMLADKAARLIGGPPRDDLPVWDLIKDALTPQDTRPGSSPWYSNYDFLWGG